jgi:hypothetical protein
MKRAALLFVLLALAALCSVSCSGADGFGKTRSPPRLVVEIDPTARRGAPEAPLDLAVDTPFPFRVTIRALDVNGNVDPSFNRYVRLSSKPGAIEPLVGGDVDGRNVLLKGGESVQVEVRIANAYGTTYIVADDLGYVPADPLRDPPPACSNGIDDDGDGAIDFPADNGCAFANDDAEAGGSFGEGASQPIFFKLPRIADVRGLKCEPTLGCSSNGATPYPKEQIQLDTGFRDDNTFAFDTVVTRISSDGFYVSDINDPRKAGFNSIFAFNFNAPPRMRVCDRLKTYGGTANEFFGFTQISYPTWTLEEWDPARRLCLVPIPDALSPGVISDTAELRRLSGNLVRVQTPPGMGGKAKVTPKFGPADVTKSPGGLYTPSADASNCDFDKNGKINSFVVGDPEGDCSTACTADPECTEWSNYVSRSTFRITVIDSNGAMAAIQADATSSAGFDPLAMKGKEIRSFSGTMHFFSGGSQFTIEARCKDDIIVALDTPPFVSDTPCMDDAGCATTVGFPPNYKCVALGDPQAPATGPKGCRRLDPERPDVKEPPPLACVFPRTFLENNPQ